MMIAQDVVLNSGRIVNRLWATLALLAAIPICTGCQMGANGQNADGARLYQQGQYQAAIQRFQKALASDPNNADAYYNMASAYHRMGSLNHDKATVTQAEGLYDQCLDIDPNHTDCYRGLAVLLVETERPEKAFTLLKGWTSRNPQNINARIELARLYKEWGDTESARVNLEQAVAIDATSRDSSRAWAALASLREESGDYSQAMANYQRAHGLNSFQTGLTQRMAALQQKVVTSSAGATAPNTRVVQTPPAGRY
jgi:tetratricopeptide (TPR) repeat protein